MRHDVGLPVPRSAVRLAQVIVTCAALAACAGSSAPSPGTPTGARPTPAPSPIATPLEFLHLPQPDGRVTTYRVDAATGQLDLALTQDLGPVHALAGDPRGRYVYAAYGPTSYSAASREDASIVLHEVDESGRLVAGSESPSRPWPTSTSCRVGHWGWTWLAGSAGRVWGQFMHRFGGGCQHQGYIGVTHAVSEQGDLGPAVLGDTWIDGPAAALDPDEGVLYKQRYGWGYYGPAALTAHVAGPDGHLKCTGYSSLCAGTNVATVAPLGAVRGFVFGRFGQDEPTVCSWEGRRLAPRPKLGFDSSMAAAFSPFDKTTPALLAMAEDVTGPAPRRIYRHTDLRLLSLGGEGELTLLDHVELPSPTSQLLFDPSGSFLYVAVADSATLLAYRVDFGRRLEPIEGVAGAVGLPFMAISVHQGLSQP